MNAIILAAGQGTRLNPLTDSMPKCMVKLFDKSILEWQIDVLHNCGIIDITIVTGYLHEKIKFDHVNYIHNDKYNETNMVESLFCAKEKLDNSTLISYGDIIFEKNVLQKLIDATAEICIMIDKNWEKYWSIRFENPLEYAESLLLDSHNKILDIGQKVNSISEIRGQYLGLMKFQGQGINKLISFYEKAKTLAKTGHNPLNPKLSFQNSFMTDFLNGMIKDGIKLNAINTNGGWLELDSLHDYEIYNEMYKNNKISEFFSIDE